MSTRETVTVFCPNTHREVVGLVKKSLGISEQSEIILGYDFVYCSGQSACGENTGKNCPLSQRKERPLN